MAKVVIGNKGTLRRHRLNSDDKEQLLERRRSCVHALLNRPWITKEKDQELYYWIKEQYFILSNWFLEYTGYSLIVTKAFIKLDKFPTTVQSWMGFEELREPLDYAFFTYGLWYLEAKTELDQFLLTHLVEEIRTYMVEQGMAVDWKNYNHRSSMTRALKRLKNLDVIKAIDGNESDWAYDSSNNVLYECSMYSHYVLRKFPRELMAYQTIQELEQAIVYPDTVEGRTACQRHRVYRRILLEPVILDKQWDRDDLYYILTHQQVLMEQMNMMLGWEGRRYAEGLLFFNPGLTSESKLFPTLSSISDLVLLVAGEIRRLCNDTDPILYLEDDGSLRVSKSEMEHILICLKEKCKEYWSKEHREAASRQLAAQVFEHLEEWGFGVWEDSQHFLLYPVAGRWDAEYVSYDFNTF